MVFTKIHQLFFKLFALLTCSISLLEVNASLSTFKVQISYLAKIPQIPMFLAELYDEGRSKLIATYAEKNV
jgi:hypothetical protein